MRMSIGIPGFSIYFEHHQVNPTNTTLEVQS
jgi:hypothetical protein